MQWGCRRLTNNSTEEYSHFVHSVSYSVEIWHSKYIEYHNQEAIIYLISINQPHLSAFYYLRAWKVWGPWLGIKFFPMYSLFPVSLNRAEYSHTDSLFRSLQKLSANIRLAIMYAQITITVYKTVDVYRQGLNLFINPLNKLSVRLMACFDSTHIIKEIRSTSLAFRVNNATVVTPVQTVSFLILCNVLINNSSQ